MRSLAFRLKKKFLRHYIYEKRRIYAFGFIALSRIDPRARRIVRRGQAHPVTILFTPQQPTFLYTIWKIVRLAGFKVLPSSATAADIVVRFDDVTFPVIDQAVRAGWYDLNRRCTDISKQQVSKVFGEVFGYGLALDPLTYRGKALSKSDENYRHDGKIIDCPIAAVEPGTAYQKLVETERDGYFVDLRARIVGTRITSVTEMRRALEHPFEDRLASCIPIGTDQALSPEEQRLIVAFCRRLGMDQGELDILRDNQDHRIYIVDANKTTCGPPPKLNFKAGYDALLLAAEAMVDQFGKEPV